jgi:hypothetical protein
MPGQNGQKEKIQTDSAAAIIARRGDWTQEKTREQVNRIHTRCSRVKKSTLLQIASLERISTTHRCSFGLNCTEQKMSTSKKCAEKAIVCQ